jgi:hypothetical protein
VQRSAAQRSAAQRSAAQRSAVQCSAVQCGQLILYIRLADYNMADFAGKILNSFANGLILILWDSISVPLSLMIDELNPLST